MFAACRLSAIFRPTCSLTIRSSSSVIKRATDNAKQSFDANSTNPHLQGNAVDRAKNIRNPDPQAQAVQQASKARTSAQSERTMDTAMSRTPTDSNLPPELSGPMADSRGGRKDSSSNMKGTVPASTGGGDSDIGYILGQRGTRKFTIDVAQRVEEQMAVKKDGFSIPTVQLTDRNLYGEKQDPESVEKGNDMMQGQSDSLEKSSINGSVLTHSNGKSTKSDD